MSPKSAPCEGRAQDMQDAKPDFGVSVDDLADLLEVNLSGRGVNELFPCCDRHCLWQAHCSCGD
jgi:hypothetical protein